MIRKLIKTTLLCGWAALSVSALAAPDTARGDDVEWTRYGLDYAEQRFSPLNSINDETVGQLGLDWFFELQDVRGVQATPLMHDGVLYFTGSWNRVYAVDARTGEQIWTIDPQIDRAKIAPILCCGPMNRGLALEGDRLFLGALDGRLMALDRHSGEVLWSVQTTPTDGAYSITGAPRVVKGKVLIGNSGAEFGVRGYVTAYDTESGEQVWRFYTVPGNPEKGFEDEAQRLAADTWTGEWWQYGGGGTVWDSITYDEELDQLYIGVGNGSPHNRRIRSPEGGDNLYLSSIVALNPDSGEYLWHYQEVPAETWDYTATQHIVLTDLEWKGEPRKVILHAPKAGFVYIIDRHSGKLLSAEPFAKVTWASHYDLETGRPVENPGQDYADGPAMVYPTALGAHNWHPMSFNPETGLLYIPVVDLGTELNNIPTENYKHHARHYNLGYDITLPPLDDQLSQALMTEVPRGFLLAWDPKQQKAAWRLDHPLILNGGLLSTAGNLVFQGTNDGRFIAVTADKGEVVWSFDDVGTGIMAPPITYQLDGEQYVAVLAGRGGALSNGMGIQHPNVRANNRLLVFKLGAQAVLPESESIVQYELPERVEMSEEELLQGRTLYVNYCVRCHGSNAVSDGTIPDLRNLPPVWHEHFNQVVLGGMMEKAGMPHFADVMTEEDVQILHGYLIDEAYQRQALLEKPSWWRAITDPFYHLLAKVLGWLFT